MIVACLAGLRVIKQVKCNLVSNTFSSICCSREAEASALDLSSVVAEPGGMAASSSESHLMMGTKIGMTGPVEKMVGDEPIDCDEGPTTDASREALSTLSKTTRRRQTEYPR